MKGSYDRLKYAVKRFRNKLYMFAYLSTLEELELSSLYILF